MRSLLTLSLILWSSSSLAQDDFEDQLALGRSLTVKPWVRAQASTTARDGVGPFFNQVSCLSCHPSFGAMNRSISSGPLPFFMIVQLSHPQGYDASYGRQLSPQSVQVKKEAMLRLEYRMEDSLRKPFYHLEQTNYGSLDPQTRFSVRVPQMLLGTGIIDRLPDSWFLSRRYEEEKNKYKIKGQVSWKIRDGKPQIARFGWRADAVSLREQIAKALVLDMGLTNPTFRQDDCMPRQNCPSHSRGLDVSKTQLDAITAFVRSLKPPQGSSLLDLKGEELFKRVGCHLCHRTQSVPNHKSESIVLYSDLLLHDMGEGLSDQSSSLWRTAPLWGARTRRHFLHDGRARTIREAVMWHGGEGQLSVKQFLGLSVQDQRHLVHFVELL